MAPHSSILAWRIPWTQEPGRLQSMGSKEEDTTGQLTRSHTNSGSPSSSQGQGLVALQGSPLHH